MPDPERLRVLVVSDEYPPHSLGGYEIACRAASEALRARGLEVLVVTSNYRAAELGNDDASIRRMLHRVQDSASLPRLAWWETQDSRRLLRIVARWKPDVIYAWRLLHLFPSLHLLLERLPVPVVLNLQDTWLHQHLAESRPRWHAWQKRGAGLARRGVKAALRPVLRGWAPAVMRAVTSGDIAVPHAVFCSRFRLQQHLDLGLAAADPVVIYNGVDLARFVGLPRRPAADLRLLFAGRLVEEKGVLTLVDALATLIRRGTRGIRATIAGIPSYPHEYAEQVHERIRAAGLQEQVRVVPAVANEKMPDLYGRHDALVFPSIGPEGFPMTVIEAAACGLALVTTLTGGTGEFVEDGKTGLAFPPGDSVALACRLDTLAHSPDLARRLATWAQQRARQLFDARRIGDLTDAHLRSVVCRARRAPDLASAQDVA